MKRIVIKPPNYIAPEAGDLGRIQRVFADRDYALSREEAKSLWSAYSATQSVIWHGLPDQDTELFNLLRSYWQVDAEYCSACNERFATRMDGKRTHIDDNDNALSELDEKHLPWTIY